jgi:hypothetical protein
MKKETWEVELDANMNSIRASYKSIRRSYYSIMGIMSLVLCYEIGTTFLGGL